MFEGTGNEFSTGGESMNRQFSSIIDRAGKDRLGTRLKRDGNTNDTEK